MDDPHAALSALCEAVGAHRMAAASVAQGPFDGPLPEGPLSAEAIAQVLACTLPKNPIVVDVAVTTGRAFDAAFAGAAPHDWLTGCGGAIGFGFAQRPRCRHCGTGSARACARRRRQRSVLAQALWSMARKGLNVTTVIFVNRAYGILRGELAAMGAGAPGARATDMLSLDKPPIDWAGLGRALGVAAVKVGDLAALATELRRSYRTPGPTLIEAIL